MDKQPQNKNKHKRLWLIIAASIFVSILFGILIFVLITNLAARKHQLDLLNSASNDLHQLYVRLLDDPSIQKDTISYAKKCFQASAKLSKGTITCGPRGQFKKTVPYNLAKLDVSLEEFIKKDNAFSKVTVDEFNKGEQNAWSSIEFVHTDTSIKCFVNYVAEDNLTDYILGCNQVVPDFLTGYAVEK